MTPDLLTSNNYNDELRCAKSTKILNRDGSVSAPCFAKMNKEFAVVNLGLFAVSPMF